MTKDPITAELEADEEATLQDPAVRSMAKEAVALAEATAPGNLYPNPALPSGLYGDLICEAERLSRLRFVAKMGERKTGGYLTRETVTRDVAAVMRQAMKLTQFADKGAP